MRGLVLNAAVKRHISHEPTSILTRLPAVRTGGTAGQSAGRRVD